MFKDLSGVFDDFGFKLVVINSLLDKENSFSKELKELKAKYLDTYEWGTYEVIPDMLDFFQNLKLTKEDLALVTELTFDGGEEIYELLMPDWDGESEEFDVNNVKGFEKLSNLKKVEYISMCDEKLMKQFERKGIRVV